MRTCLSAAQVTRMVMEHGGSAFDRKRCFSVAKRIGMPLYRLNVPDAVKRYPSELLVMTTRCTPNRPGW